MKRDSRLAQKKEGFDVSNEKKERNRKKAGSSVGVNRPSLYPRYVAIFFFILNSLPPPRIGLRRRRRPSRAFIINYELMCGRSQRNEQQDNKRKEKTRNLGENVGQFRAKSSMADHSWAEGSTNRDSSNIIFSKSESWMTFIFFCYCRVEEEICSRRLPAVRQGGIEGKEMRKGVN